MNTAKGPETIKFDDPYTQVSIKVAGGNNSESFRLDAYDAAGKLVATNTVTTKAFQTLAVSATEIRKVVVTNTSAFPDYYVYDDLSFTATPEPGILLVGTSVAWLMTRRRRADGRKSLPTPRRKPWVLRPHKRVRQNPRLAPWRLRPSQRLPRRSRNH